MSIYLRNLHPHFPRSRPRITRFRRAINLQRVNRSRGQQGRNGGKKERRESGEEKGGKRGGRKERKREKKGWKNGGLYFQSDGTEASVGTRRFEQIAIIQLQALSLEPTYVIEFDISTAEAGTARSGIGIR